MQKDKRHKIKTHEAYKFRKRFFRKFNRKPFVLLDKFGRKNRKKLRWTKKKSTNNSRRVIKLPAVISLKVEYRDAFFSAIQDINSLLEDRQGIASISIDHSHIKHIDPEALLILASEIKRYSSTLPAHNKFRYSKKYGPKTEHIKSLLGSIGYWEHFQIKASRYSKITDEYFRIHHDTQSTFQAVTDIRDFFENKLSFIQNYSVEEAFDNALSEAIANVVEHAYSGITEIIGVLPRAWWIAGYYERDNNELTFCCYDHGIGIKDSLLQHKNDRIARWTHLTQIRLKEDGDVIKLLLTQKIKTNHKKDRGYGTQQFIKLIDKYEKGSLEIYSKKGYYGIVKNGKDKKDIIRNYDEAMDGTLIVWKIKLERVEDEKV